MADKVVVDCTTGEVETAPLTAEEQAEADARAAAGQAEREASEQREQRRQQAITRLEAFWTNRDTLTAAQVRTEAAFTARVLAKVLPYLDLDPE